jgi:hypothetical protein
MYCPKCGTQNNDDVKFCRGCGENLKVISQAMSRRAPVILASKIDAYFESKNERFRRDSILAAIMGSLWLLFGIKTLITGAGSLPGFPITMGCLLLIWSVWQYMLYKRALFIRSNAENIRAASPAEGLQIHDVGQIKVPPASINEFTTEPLDRSAGRPK